jgi:hypothetical protein
MSARTGRQDAIRWAIENREGVGATYGDAPASVDEEGFKED